MSTITIAFLGDIFASPGRRVVGQQLPVMREELKPDLVIANAENAARGSGLSPDLYRKLREAGIDAMTLGDHAYREPKITELLQRPEEPVSRPANLSGAAVGKAMLRLPAPGDDSRSIYVITLLGRVFMTLPANDPFETIDRMLEQIPERNPIVIVEAHMEATSEKAAIAHHLNGRVTAVLGTHTHIPTADARVLPGGTAFITDMGMCGPYDSIIGREKASVLRYMTTGMFIPFGIGAGDEAMCGVCLRIDADSGRAVAIDRFEYRADRNRPPFDRNG
jgi:metallophosphoesterase (TIGR00282 family)